MKEIIFKWRNITIATICSLLITGCYVPLGMKLNDEKVDSIGRAKSVSIAEQILRNHQKVCVAFIAGNILEYGQPSLAGKSELLNTSERLWLNYFVNFPNFSIADRTHLAQIMDELKLNSSGLISESSRIKIGELTGATHLIIIEARRWESFWINEATTYWKLIDIESGRVLSIDEINYSKFRVL
jgi:hypothetical protein